LYGAQMDPVEGRDAVGARAVPIYARPLLPPHIYIVVSGHICSMKTHTISVKASINLSSKWQ
jgi:hypothetical protein